MAERYLQAGSIRLDREDERLWKDGEPVSLGQKSFAIIKALMENPQILITKDELFERVWPDLAVSDAVLTTAIKELRQALGDNARSPSVVETVYGRGYRFLLAVEPHDTDPAESVIAQPTSIGEGPPQPAVPKPRAYGVINRWSVLALVVALIVSTIWFGQNSSVQSAGSAADGLNPKSIAVMPFADFSANKDQQWFADGLTEEILTGLARTPDLRVASRTATTRLRDSNLDVREAAKSLNVANILDGSVRRSGDHFRVTVALMRASDGVELWSRNYDRTEHDIISMQENIAYDIAVALKTVMDPAKLRAMVNRGTKSVEAYEAYLRGVAFEQQSSIDGNFGSVIDAAESFEEARKLDPNFAEAHWRSAQYWFGKATRVNTSAVWDPKHNEADRLEQYFIRVEDAIAASKDATERLKYEANRALMQLNFDGAFTLMTRYLKARPRDIDAWEDIGEISAYAGKRDWVRRAAERVQTLSIEEGAPRSRAITMTTLSLDFEHAAPRAREQLKLRRGHAMTEYQAHRALIWSGKPLEARKILDRLTQSKLPEINMTLARMRQACAEKNINQARKLAEQIYASPHTTGKWQVAQMMGDSDRAKAILQPLDQTERLPTLVQYMTYPSFDANIYPVLRDRLARDGTRRPKAIPMPYACEPV